MRSSSVCQAERVDDLLSRAVVVSSQAGQGPGLVWTQRS